MMTNTNAVVSWTYDRRGRVTAETRTIVGLGTYTYRMGYNTANQVVTTTYPTGETLQHTYTAAWQPRTLASNWATYVPDAQYNVRGQLEWFKAYTSGANSYLKTSYTYFDTGSAPSFRLKQLDVAYEDGLDNLHSRLQLAYRYDPVGNVQAITDTTNAGQVQAFGYDALERLTSAGTNGIGEGQYYDTYSYDALGNFTAMDGRTYVYDPARPHAARYSYVLNGGLYANFDAPGTPSGWDVSGAQNWAAGYPDGAELVLKHGGSTTTSTLYRSGLDLGAGDTAQVEFKVDQADPDITLRVSNDANTQGFGIMDRPGTALRVLKHTGKTVTYQDCGWSLQANTWYVLKLYVGDGTDANKFKVTVWQRDNPGQRCYKEATNTSWTGSWRYRSVANDHAPSVGTTLYQDNYFELQAGGSAFTYAYDPNGNMTARLEAGTAYSQTWDAENRLVSVRYGTTATLGNAYTFAYDADGGRVRQVAPSGAQTAYIGAYEVTITPTLSLLDTFPPGTNPPVGWQVPPPSGSWNASGGIYQQTNAGLQDALSVRTSSTGTNVQASVRVRLDTNDHALAGLALRSAGGVGGAAYIVAIRNSLSGYHCGIFKKVTGVWTAMTPDQSVCKVPLGGWHVVGARVVDVGATDTRIEMLLDGVHILTWTDTSNRLAAGSLGLVTRSGAASFDDVTYHVLAGTNPDEFRTYYAFGAARLAVRHGVGASTGSAAPLYYLAADHLGSVSLAIQTNGQVIGTRAYYLPFGAERGTPASGLPTDRRFVGEIQTPYIELQQFGARWYSSRLGRFVSPDSIVPNPGNPQTHNRYSYVNNRPCTLVDPTGHWACGDADWEAEYEQAHGGEAPYAGAVDDCKLSGSISGGLTWTDTDWIAYTAAKYAGLMRWLSRGVKFAGSWKGIDVEAAILGLNMVQSALGSKADAALHLGNTGLTITAIQGEGPGGLAWPDRISLWFWYNLQPTDSTQFAYAVWTVVHEIGHVVEYSAGFDADAWGAGVPGWYKTSGAWRYNTSADGRPQGNRGYVRPFSVQDVRDDFADTFAAHVYMLGRSPLPYDIIDNLPMMIPSRERWEALNVVLGNLP